MKRSFLSAPVLGMICCLGVVGCQVHASAGVSSSDSSNFEYESCDNGASCAGGTGTVCQQTEFQSGAGAGLMCTASCYTSSDCPPDYNGGSVVCVINPSEPAGQCYIDCNYRDDCKGGTSCVSLDDFLVCAP